VESRAITVMVALKFDLEHAQSDVHKIGAAIGGVRFPAMHSRRGVAYVVVTEESEDQLLDRLRPTLKALASVDNCWAFIIDRNVAALHGSIDPLVSRVNEAWDRAWQRNQSKNMRHPKWG
jgi:hypothetical protein